MKITSVNEKAFDLLNYRRLKKGGREIEVVTVPFYWASVDARLVFAL